MRREVLNEQASNSKSRKGLEKPALLPGRTVLTRFFFFSLNLKMERLHNQNSRFTFALGSAVGVCRADPGPPSWATVWVAVVCPCPGAFSRGLWTRMCLDHVLLQKLGSWPLWPSVSSAGSGEIKWARVLSRWLRPSRYRLSLSFLSTSYREQHDPKDGTRTPVWGFSNVNMPTPLLQILLQCRFWFIVLGWGLGSVFWTSPQMIAWCCWVVGHTWNSKAPPAAFLPASWKSKTSAPVGRKHLQCKYSNLLPSWTRACPTRSRWAEETCSLWVQFQAPGIGGRHLVLKTDSPTL